MPWVHLIVGEAQFQCMMAYLWENMYEDSDFGPPRPAVYPTGAPGLQLRTALVVEKVSSRRQEHEQKQPQLVLPVPAAALP